MDWSTINKDKLHQLQPYTTPTSYHLQKDSGNGCAGDPPGYPTYFTRSVYTAQGNSPRRGATLVLGGYVVEKNEDWEGVKGWDEYRAERDAVLHSLWNPLPLDHPRTRAWIRDSYRHLNKCYRDEERPEYGRAGTLIFPVPSYKLKKFYDEARFNDDYRTKERAAVDAYNRAEFDRANAIATPDNHMAVVKIRRFYPEYQPEQDLIDNPPRQVEGMWWETDAVQPTPENCCPRWHLHAFGKSGAGWCQWCGWQGGKP